MISALEKRCEKIHCVPLFPDILDENRLVDSLECFQKLEGHAGCVNTLRWNKTGNLLASGSDDRNVKIWRADSEVYNLTTEHEGNVFAVEFLPDSDDKKLVTGAADEVLFLHDIESKSCRRWHLDGRIKRICTVQYDPTLYWAAVEDEKAVYQFDTRLESPEVVVKSNETNQMRDGKTVAISEANPHLLVVGFDETTVRLYDRRNFDESLKTFAPGFTTKAAYHATHVAFNSSGTEIVVNYGCGGGIVVYSIDETKQPKIMERFHSVINKSKESVISSGNLPYPELREVGSNAIREKRFTFAIDYYSDLINRNYTDNAFHSVCHSNRATASLLRRQRGDTYSCIRDSVKALEIHRGNSKALFRLVKSFMTLEQIDLAKICVEKFKEWFPNDNSIAKMEEEIEKAEMKESDYVEGALDYQQRFIGSLNHQTDIKEANFFGSRDQYIISGSDCGHMFIWNRETSKIQGIWKADEHILNIVQPHPHHFMLATSGIDDDILLWQPHLNREDVEGFESRRQEDSYQYLENRASGGPGNLLQLHMLRELTRENTQCVQS